MSKLALADRAESQTPSRPWMTALLKTLRVVSWGLFVFSTPGMLLLVLLLSVWMAPAVVILLSLLALQVPLFVFVSRLLQPYAVESLARGGDPRFTADYWRARKSAEPGSSRNT